MAVDDIGCLLQDRPGGGASDPRMRDHHLDVLPQLRRARRAWRERTCRETEDNYLRLAGEAEYLSVIDADGMRGIQQEVYNGRGRM